MSIRPRVAASVCVWALVALAYACSAQPPAGDAQKQIDDLRAQVAGMQKDIDAIKSAVAAPASEPGADRPRPRTGRPADQGLAYREADAGRSHRLPVNVLPEIRP